MEGYCKQCLQKKKAKVVQKRAWGTNNHKAKRLEQNGNQRLKAKSAPSMCESHFQDKTVSARAIHPQNHDELKCQE